MERQYKNEDPALKEIVYNYIKANPYKRADQISTALGMKEHVCWAYMYSLIIDQKIKQTTRVFCNVFIAN